MLNNIENSPAFSGVKYTKAGRKFMQTQSEASQQLLNNAESMMKKYRKANLIVNSSGYTIQTRDIQKPQCYKINKILFTCDNDIFYYVSDPHGQKFTKSFKLKPKQLNIYERCAAQDVTEKNGWLNSTIELINLLEKTENYYIRKPWYIKLKERLMNKS